MEIWMPYSSVYMRKNMCEERWIEGISKENYDSFCSSFQKNYNLFKEKQIVIFGAGIMGLQFRYILEELGISDALFCDNDEKKWKEKKRIAGKKVLCPNALQGQTEKFFVFLAMERYGECANQLNQLGYEENLNWVNLKNCSETKLLEDFQRNRKVSTLILGDCTSNVISIKDCCKSSIAEMLDGENEIKVLALNGLYMRWYYNLLLMSLKTMPDIKKVILLLDVSIFQEMYSFFSNTQHTAVLEKLRDISKIEKDETNLFINEASKREKKSINLGQMSPNRTDSLSEKELVQARKIHMRLNYLFPIKEQTESIEYLDKFVQTCVEKEIETYIVILPINHKVGERYFPDTFYTRYEKIRDCVMEHVLKEKGKILDESYSLDEEDFISLRSVNEGIKEDGRKKLVKDIQSIL